MGFSDLFKPKWKHSNPKKRLIAVQKMTDMKKLMQIIHESRENALLEAAINNLNDTSLLIEAYKNIHNKYHRSLAISKMSDEILITDQIISGWFSGFEQEVIGKIKNYENLKNIILKAKSNSAKQWAAKLSNNEDLLVVYLSRSQEFNKIDKDLLVKVANENNLEFLVKCSYCSNTIRIEAIKRIENKNFITEIAFDKTIAPLVRVEAINKIENNKIIQKILDGHSWQSYEGVKFEKYNQKISWADYFKVQSAAILKLTDINEALDIIEKEIELLEGKLSRAKFLVDEVSKGNKSKYIIDEWWTETHELKPIDDLVEGIIEKVTDIEKLKSSSLYNIDRYHKIIVKRISFLKIKEEDELSLIKRFNNTNEYDIQEEILNKIKDQTFLKSVVMTHIDMHFRLYAVSIINDQNILEIIALNDNFVKVHDAVLKRLDREESLAAYAKKWKNSDGYYYVISRLKSQYIIDDVLENSSSDIIMEMAIRRYKEKGLESLINLSQIDRFQRVLLELVIADKIPIFINADMAKFIINNITSLYGDKFYNTLSEMAGKAPEFFLEHWSQIYERSFRSHADENFENHEDRESNFLVEGGHFDNSRELHKDIPEKYRFPENPPKL